MGLSFSVPPGKAIPSSLQNIYKEIRDDCGCTVPKHGDLEKVSSHVSLAYHETLAVIAVGGSRHADQRCVHTFPMILVTSPAHSCLS